MAQFPDESVAFHVMVVVPIGSMSGASFVITGKPPMTLVADAIPSRGNAVRIPVALTDMSIGGVTVGGVISCGADCMRVFSHATRADSTAITRSAAITIPAFTHVLQNNGF